MPLSEVEKNIVNRVVQRFLNDRKATLRRELLLDFEEPEAIDRLHQWMLIQTGDATNYLPTAIAFHYCGDAEIQALASRSTQIVAHVLSKLLREDNPSLAPVDIKKRAKELYGDVDEKTIRLGLYLAPDLHLITGYQGRNPSQPDVIPTAIYEGVVKLKKFDTLWDDYVRKWADVAGPPFDRAQVGGASVTALPSVPRVRKRKSQITGLAREVKIEKPEKVALKSQVKTEWVPKRWKIIRSLPEGGQGWTYLVERASRSDQSKYVLKRLKNKERLARFQNEIEALTKLSHPGILRIIETSRPDEEAFYVSEFCEKGDLSKLPLSQMGLLPKLRLFREICDAMAAAHKANIIHRDLKPQNILIRHDGSVAIGDFGLCLDLNDLEERFTSSTEAVGPRNYIAPELEDGRVTDPKPASDCYSLGKLLYDILSGRSFARERHRDTGYDLRTSDGNIGTYFVYELLDKTITANPLTRLQNAAELLTGLDSVILMIEQNAHVLDIQVPQHCLYCISGHYGPMSDTGSIHELRFRCSRCGNVQIFVGGGYPWWTPPKR